MLKNQHQNPKPMTQEWKQYRRKGLSEMRPYVKGEDLTGISINEVDNPETDLGMIARNPKNHNDKWYVARKYFEENLELAQQPIPQEINIAGEWLHDFFSEHSTIIGIGESKMSRQKWQEAANGIAQLLLPELQQLRETVSLLTTEIEKATISNNNYRTEIEQQKSQIDTFTKTLVEYAEQIVKQEAERKEQAAKIETLKKKLRNLYFLYREQTTSMTNEQITKDFEEKYLQP